MKVNFDKALKLLSEGHLVGVPTETVYGLAASIEQPEAIKNIFKLKQRPFFDPLIVHIHSMNQARELVLDADFEILEKIAPYFWPGPLTVILNKTQKVSDAITSGFPTVALRMPSHPLFLKLLKELNQPLAAPSANPFTKTSPTCFEHVEKYFPELPTLDGGSCNIGIESTIIDLSSPGFLSLCRPGQTQLSKIKNRVPGLTIKKATSGSSPGDFKQHYQPEVPLFVIYNMDEVHQFKDQKYELIKLSDSPTDEARKLYSYFHDIKKETETLVLLWQQDKNNENWAPLWNRIEKASSN